MECASVCLSSPTCFSFMLSKESYQCQYGNGGSLRVPAKNNISTLTQAIYVKHSFSVPTLGKYS